MDELEREDDNADPRSASDPSQDRPADRPTRVTRRPGTPAFENHDGAGVSGSWQQTFLELWSFGACGGVNAACRQGRRGNRRRSTVDEGLLEALAKMRMTETCFNRTWQLKDALCWHQRQINVISVFIEDDRLLLVHR